MEKLELSIGILSWKSGQTLVNTLQTYFDNNLGSPYLNNFLIAISVILIQLSFFLK